MSPRENLRDIAIKSAVGILIIILIYIAIGVAVNSLSVKIYDSFPSEFTLSQLDQEQTLICYIYNNAPLTLPFINPFYGARVLIENMENDTFAYFLSLGDKKCNFTQYSLDLGRIDSGSNKEFTFFLHLGPHNVTFKIEIQYVFILPFTVASATYCVEYKGNQTYTISK